MSHTNDQEPESYQSLWSPSSQPSPATSVLITIIIGIYILLKIFSLFQYPVRRYLHRLVWIFIGMPQRDSTSLGLHGSDSSKITQQQSKRSLNQIFGLNPASLLHKGVCGVAGAWSATASNVPPGLGNTSNSCYQNSVVQGLASLPSLRGYLAKMTAENSSLSMETTSGALYHMIRTLNDPRNYGQHFWIRGKLKSMSVYQQQDAQEYLSTILGALDEEIKKALGSKAWFSSSLWEATRSRGDLLAKHQDPNTDPEHGPKITRALTGRREVIRNPLDGLLAQRVGCMACGYCEGLSLIPFNCLTVSLGRRHGYDIRECLDEYTSLEFIDGVECAKCSLLRLKDTLTPLAVADSNSPFTCRLNAVQEALEEEDFEDKTLTKKINLAKKNWVQSTKSKQAVIARAPVSLILHINRSNFDETTGLSFKNNASVSYPQVLDMRDWCLGGRLGTSHQSDTLVEEWPRNPKESMLSNKQSDSSTISQFQYKLRAAVSHYGSHGSGHYVCFRPHPRASDFEQTGKDTPESAKDRQNAQREQWWRFSDDNVYAISEHEAHQGNVFMLFYERCDRSASSSKDTPIVALTAEVENAPLPPIEIMADPHSLAGEEAAAIPLPDVENEEELAVSLSECDVRSEAETMVGDRLSVEEMASRTIYTNTETQCHLAFADADTEMSEAESEGAPSTQLTSDYESETDFVVPSTPKKVAVPKVPPCFMRTAGNSSSRGQESRKALPLVSAT